MARSIAGNRVTQAYRQQVGPGLVVDEIEYYKQPQGINNLAKLSQIGPQFASDITNLVLDDGCLRSRKGVESLGAEDSRSQAIFSFTPQNGSSVLLRIRTDGVDSWNGFTWLPVVDIILNGNQDDFPTWTGWGNELLICNGADKIVSYNPVSGAVKVLTESSPARHITSFNGRVVASAVTDGSFYGARVRWSVKLNNEDWTAETTTDAIGAGYEDLLAAPGGYVDEVMGVYPISDETAIMVRENSIWMVLVTGDVNSPFRFSRLAGSVGCRARRSIAITPFGIVFPTMEDVIIVDQSGPQVIGTPVRRGLFPTINDFDDLVGEYDPRRREYRLSNNSTVWRYKFDDKGWTKDEYPFNVRHMSFVSYRSLGLTFDQLEGTFDDLTGTFDNLNLPFADEGIDFISSSMLGPEISAPTRIALREDVAITNDNTIAAPIQITSGLLNDGSVREKTTIIEAQLEYECEEAQRLIFEYSNDKGNSWNQYSYVDVDTTSGPQVLSVRKTLTHHNLQIKVRADTLGKLSLISLALFVVRGGKVHP